MGSLIVDKKTLQILIRSADQARKDLMGFNLGLQERGLPSPEGFAGKVREVRKIHDFLGRAGRSPEDTLSLDFALKERILLGSCLHHLKTQVDQDLRLSEVSKSQRRTLEEMRSRINFLIAKMHAPGVGMLIKGGELRLNQPLDLDPADATLDIDLTEGARSSDASMDGRQGDFRLFNGNRFVAQDGRTSIGSEPRSTREEGSTAAGLEPPSSGPCSFSTVDLDFGFRSLQKPLGLPDPLPEIERADGCSDAQASDPGARAKGLFNPRMVKHPKIRTLVRLDLQDFNQAKKAQSLRRVLVHLLGCFEGLLLDHVIQDVGRYDLDPKEVADWDLLALAQRVFSGKLDASQIRCLIFLFEARSYLSAAQMLVSSRVLTKVMVQAAESLTRWMISELGYDQVQDRDHSVQEEAPKLWRSGRA